WRQQAEVEAEGDTWLEPQWPESAVTPSVMAAPSPQPTTTTRTLRQRRHYLLAGRHILGHRLAPCPDDRHRSAPSLPRRRPSSCSANPADRQPIIALETRR